MNTTKCIRNRLSWFNWLKRNRIYLFIFRFKKKKKIWKMTNKPCFLLLFHLKRKTIITFILVVSSWFWCENFMVSFSVQIDIRHRWIVGGIFICKKLLVLAAFNRKPIDLIFLIIIIFYFSITLSNNLHDFFICW